MRSSRRSSPYLTLALDQYPYCCIRGGRGTGLYTLIVCPYAPLKRGP